jgi:hypothetical protein
MSSSQVLDLSHNRLVRIEGLDGLLKLKSLRLAYNEIGKLEGLDHLAALEVRALFIALIEFDRLSWLDRGLALIVRSPGGARGARPIHSIDRVR